MDDNFGLSAEEFRIQAVYSDETRQFRSPAEPTAADWVNVRLRVGRGTVSAVFLCTNEREYLMEEAKTQGAFSYFQATLPPTAEEMTYYFRLQCGEAVGYYTKYGFFSEYKHEGEFRIFRDYRTPDWAKGAVMYQIYPDRFANGDVSNDVKTNEYIYLKQKTEQVTDWNSLPAASDINRFYGGDLQGVLNKLDYLAELGVEVLYFNPLFVSPSNHKYDTQDYWHIDPHFGKIVRESGSVLAADAKTNETASLYAARTTADENLAASDALFAELIQQAHARGMRVILDGVFNHTGYDSRYFNGHGRYDSLGAHQSKDSPYYPWFDFSEWPDKYGSWWGIYTLPQVNEHNEDYQNYIFRDADSVVRRWLRLGASGWRLDVADELPDDFIAGLNAAAKKEKPDVLVIGEVWEDASNKIAYSERRRYFGGGELDSVMNYPLRDAILAYLNGGTAEHFAETMETLRENYPRAVFYNLMNIIGTHDTARALTILGVSSAEWKMNRDERAHYTLPPERLDSAKRRLRLAAVIQFTMPGSPTIYYGDEAGRQGFEDPFNRRTYPWGAEDREILAFYRRLCEIHADSDTLAHGELRFDTGENDALLRYERTTEHSRLVVLVNRSRQEVKTNVNALYALDLLTNTEFDCTGGNGIELAVPAETAYLLRCFGSAE